MATQRNAQSTMGANDDYITQFGLAGQGEHTSGSTKSNEYAAPRNAVKQTFGFRLPLIGKLAPATQIRILVALLALFALSAILIAALNAYLSNQNAMHLEVASDTLTQSERLTKASLGAIQGDEASFKQVKDSRQRIGGNLMALLEGGVYDSREVSAAPEDARPVLKKTIDVWSRTELAAGELINNETALNRNALELKQINQMDAQLSEAIDLNITLNNQGGNQASQLAASQLSVLHQRIVKNASDLVNSKSLNNEAAFGLNKDIIAFRQVLTNLEKNVVPGKAQTKDIGDTLKTINNLFAELNARVLTMLANTAKTRSAKNGEQFVFNQSDDLKRNIEALLSTLTEERSTQNAYFLLAGTLVGLAVLLGALIAKVIVDDNNLRTTQAETARNLAQQKETEVKQANDQNQTAILRLMNELQDVADGNLMVQATVSEDVTGAIADSVNYTVEELRTLVGRINVTAQSVAEATDKTRQSTAMLLGLSDEQSGEIKATGERVLQMASNITAVSTQAENSAQVAQRALEASKSGQSAVQASLKGMNEIRDQIQDTAKRIKRLGESSQQISEIVELITDITEQTNVLALNAAIQAASAGEAGRGFTVVAEEVQRLAERSANATKQIAALVRTIQTDTQDAVRAMEKSTQGVVQGAKLADTAGEAINDISSVSQDLAGIILNIAQTTRGQVEQAQVVSSAMTRILSITEKTSASTRQSSISTEELSRLAVELKRSVARFKVSA